MEQSTVTELLSALTAPLYKTSFAASTADVVEADERTCAGVSGKIALRQQELRLDTQPAREVEYAALRERATELLAEAAGLVRLNNVKQ